MCWNLILQKLGQSSPVSKLGFELDILADYTLS